MAVLAEQLTIAKRSSIVERKVVLHPRAYYEGSLVSAPSEAHSCRPHPKQALLRRTRIKKSGFYGQAGHHDATFSLCDPIQVRLRNLST